MKNTTLHILAHFFIYNRTTTVSFQTHVETEHCIVEIPKHEHI